MQEERTNVPKIRFKGYAKEWEERKLDKIFGKIRNAFVGTASPYYVDEGHFYLESNNVKDGQINRKTEVFINDEFYEKQKDKWLHTNDIVMVQSGHVGHTAVIPEDLDKTAAHALIMFSNYKTKTSPFFLNYQFQTLTAKRKLENITTGNTIKHILASEMKKFEVTIPEYDEQKHIGTLFKQLDDTIALHQRGLDLLKQTKKSYLQKMFPKKGEDKPEIRFSGFTDAWEQRKLGELGKTQSGIGFPDAEQGGSEGIPFFKVSDMNNIGNEYEMRNANHYVSDEQIERKKWKPIKDVPAIIFAKVGAAIMLNRKRLVTSSFLIDNNTMAYMFNNTWDIYFGKILFETINLPRYSQVGALPSYNSSDIESIDVKVPVKDEQQKIGSFFKQLDDTIALHQHELDSLKEMKKSLLQQMFV
ncbi:restriction endonuclease subunit S [Enterococcus faecium]|nr:restriction endonuclease subunit S [Enterococcus faecium]